jgi:hypothetical protein
VRRVVGEVEGGRGATQQIEVDQREPVLLAQQLAAVEVAVRGDEVLGGGRIVAAQ